MNWKAAFGIGIGMGVLGFLFFSPDSQEPSSSSNTTPTSESAPMAPPQDLIGEPDPNANPNATFGGTYTTWGSSFPKALNMWLDYNSFSAEIMGLLFEPLVTLHSEKNEPVGVLAESWEISEDRKTFTFKIHQMAKWSDGTPITAKDFQFYYDVIMDPKNLTSLFRVGLDRFERPKVIDSHTLEVTAKSDHWKNFWEVGGLMAFPKHLWKDKDFNKQRFQFPVVSGPYRIKELKKNRFLLLERRADWWGSALAYNQYKYNFAKIRYRFMADRKKALEAFKKGDFDVYPVHTASLWANETQFDQVQKNWVIRQHLYNKHPLGFQGFAVNLRQSKFQDLRVRQALAHLLNRELMNEKLMHNAYFMLNSFFPDLYPNNVNPDLDVVAYDSQKARKLLEEAGWIVGDDGLRYKGGELLSIQFVTAMTDHRHLNIYVEDLKKVGIAAQIEQLSWATIRKRLDNHEFDLYWSAWGATRLRDPEAMWHSKTANQVASNNIPGFQNAEVDALIEKQKTIMDLNERNALLKQMDQLIQKELPYVMLWQSNQQRLLYWNKFGMPKFLFSKYGEPDDIIVYWWYDADKSKKLEAAKDSGQPLPPEPADVRYQAL